MKIMLGLYFRIELGLWIETKVPKILKIIGLNCG